MMRTVSAAVVAVCAASGLAEAGQWGFGVGVGVAPPVIYGPPPGYYYGPPVVVEPGAPVYYERVPPFYAPGPELEMLDPGEVMDRLEAVGYHDLSPMAHRGDQYRLRAVDPSGNLVSLRLSIFTGEIEREDILQNASVSREPEIRRPPKARRAARLPKSAPKLAVAGPSAAPPVEDIPPEDETDVSSQAEAPSAMRDRLQSAPEAATPESCGPLVVC